MPSSAHSPAPIPPLIPDYELLRSIGRGSYGEVWLARGITGVFRAIKVVWRDRFPDAEPFEREFSGLKAFAAIPPDGRTQLALLHIGRNDEAHFFYAVMELADDAERGRDIDPACYVPLTLAAAKRRCARLPAPTCIAYGVELARVLAALHAQGLVHRDVKPSNIIFVGGVPKLADVGLVSRTDTAVSFVGTEGFVPPEGPGTPTADVYALGKALYEISTGLDRSQFPQLPAELHQIADRRALLNLNDVVLRACDPDPRRRYPNASAMLADLLALQNGRTPRRIVRALVPALALAAVVAALAWVAGTLISRSHRTTSDSADIIAQIPDPSTLVVAPLAKAIAVLPLAYLGSDAEKGFFADGMHAEIIATLGRIPEMRVLARESVLSFRDSTEPLPAIGRRLGVGNIITGTVRCSENIIRVQLQLRRADDEALLWFQTYDREFRELISVQAAIAEDVARVLQARNAIDATGAKFLTRNSDAYAAFLQASAFYRGERDVGRKPALHQAIALLEEAMRLDPNFMPAASQLSQAHVILVLNHERDPAQMVEHAAAGRRWAERASELVPGGGGDAALAYYYAAVEIDFVRSCALALKVVQAWPNAGEPCVHLANGLSGLGRPDLGVRWNHRAMAINPSWLGVRSNNLMALASLRWKQEWREEVGEIRALMQGPQARNAMIPLSRFRVFGELPTEEERKILPTRLQVEALYRARRFAEALVTSELGLQATDLGDFDRFELQRWRAEILQRLHRPHDAELAARENFDLAERLRAVPEIDATEKDARLAQALAGLGRYDEAIVAAHRAIEAMPIPAQQMRRWWREVTFAGILSEAHRSGEACELLAKLLRVPSWLTVPMLRVDPRWDNLREDPRFKALLDDPANDAPLGVPLNRNVPAASPLRT